MYGIDRTLQEGLLELRRQDAAIDAILGGRIDAVSLLLQKYIEEIELFNPAYGLVGAKDRRELVIKHILDSLSPLGIIARLHRAELSLQSGGEIADVGSGAGLPGIPLAITLPDVSFTLIERMGRRAGFLRNTLAALGISNVTAEEREMEKAAPDRFAIITFRAFRPLEPALLGSLFRLLKSGGILAAYKGRRSAIAEEMEAVERLSAIDSPPGWECFPCPVPFLDEERHLVVIRK
ncbi:MAG: 16S rRNA (guanine(527)-N(7))-methyltransferase RsmG [Treponema sp.]|jgi:16S rRNA (guanine527-N7)-methyltransferase|nr:16S rRNA (guanine(527)-N(7))-methyltransferase RsmG [Treponema sp.]